MNCFNGFRTASAREKHYGFCSSNNQVRVRTPYEEDKQLKFRNGKYQLKIPFILFTDFKSILNPVCEKYSEKMNQTRTERERKTPYTEKINIHVPSRCVYAARFLMQGFLIH